MLSPFWGRSVLHQLRSSHLCTDGLEESLYLHTDSLCPQTHLHVYTCAHTHTPHPTSPCLRTLAPKQLSAPSFLQLQLAPRPLFSPACPPALGTRLIKDEEGPRVGWPGAMSMQPLGPSPPPALPDTCVMSVITGDPLGRPRLAPATQAVNKAGDGVRGTRGCGDGGDASLLPGPKARPWISGAAETASHLPHRLPNLRFLS